MITGIVIGLFVAVVIGVVLVFLGFEYTAYCWSNQYKEKTFKGFLNFVWRSLCG
jgi:hypothetical protein